MDVFEILSCCDNMGKSKTVKAVVVETESVDSSTSHEASCERPEWIEVYADEHGEAATIRDGLKGLHSDFISWYEDLQDFHRVWHVEFDSLLKASVPLFKAFRSIEGVSP